MTALPPTGGEKALDSALLTAPSDSRWRYKTLVELCADFCWETDAAGKFVFVTPGGALGFSADQLVGRGAAQVWGVRLANSSLDPFLSRRDVDAADIWVTDADGAPACLELRARPLTDEAGKIVGARGICRNVTEERDRAEAFGRLQEREKFTAHFMREMRDETDPHLILSRAAENLARAVSADGCVILEKSDEQNITSKAAAAFGDTDQAALIQRKISPATPAQATPVLARDEQDAVRCRLAERVGALAPELSASDARKLTAAINETLEILARDQLPRVREIIAEAVKDSADVPQHVVELLARDSEITVAGPVLEFSPLLSDDLLIEIIRATPIDGAMTAISRRDGVAEPVSEALVEAGNEEVITTLLNNPSAQIREETLDFLADQAGSHEAWHRPLAARPSLSEKAVSSLAGVVAPEVLRQLTERADLTDRAAEELAEAVAERFSGDEVPESGPSGTSSEDALLADLACSAREKAIKALAEMGNMNISVVERPVSFASAKGIVAIAWRAGLSMRTAEQLQLNLARVPPHKLVEADDDGGYPLTEDEMAWLLEFFGK